MVPNTLGIVEKYIYFLSDHFKYIQNGFIEIGTFLNNASNRLDPFVFQALKVLKTL